MGDGVPADYGSEPELGAAGSAASRFTRELLVLPMVRLRACIVKQLEDEMHRMLLAAAAVAAITITPAFAQSECPEGTTNTGPDGGPVTCEADTTSAEPAPADQGANQGGDVLDNSNTGQEVKDAVTGVGDDNEGGNN